MYERYWKGLYASSAVHVIVLFSLLLVASEANDPPLTRSVQLAPYPELQLTQVEISLYDGPSGSAGRAAYAPEPVLEPPRPAPVPSPRLPEPDAAPATGTPRPSPAALPDRPPAAPHDPSADASAQPTAEGGGVPAGGEGNGLNPDGGSGSGLSGASGLAVAGLGSRRASCPPPRHPGVSGTVTYAVTFAPDGHYVASRPLRRGGDARLEAAVRGVLNGCRAAALPVVASQVNQEGTVTFRFTG